MGDVHVQVSCPAPDTIVQIAAFLEDACAAKMHLSPQRRLSTAFTILMTCVL